MADIAIPTHVIARTLVFNPKGQVLLLVRSADDRFRPGGFDVPGGKVDDGEDYLAAAIRETNEEVGLELDRLHVHICCATTEVGYHNRLQHDINYVCLGFVYQLAEDEDGAIQLSHEHSAFAWYAIDEAIGLSKNTTHGIFLEHLKTHNLFSDYWRQVN